jgi:uracil-DNA glycosylase
MGVETRDTPASNLAFTRSTGLAAHPGYEGAVELCAPVHRLFMDAVRPRFVMTFGSLAHFASGVNIQSVESRDARHGNWRAHRGRAVAFGHEVAFGNVPHISLWASDSRADVVEWAIAGL